jgi:hypothetical protein
MKNDELLDSLDSLTKGKSKVEDSLAEMDSKLASQVIPQTEDDLKPFADPDYKKLEKAMKSGVELNVVKNTSDEHLILSWSLPLVPEDMLSSFMNFRNAKLVEYGLAETAPKDQMIFLIEGRTFNFLQQYMDMNNIPVFTPVREGLDIKIGSRFVIPAGGSVIMTDKQMVGIEQYIKIRRFSETAETHSSWLGFLVPKKVEKVSDLRLVNRSYVAKQDVLNGALKVSQNVKPQTYIKKFSDLGSIEVATE